MPVQWNLFRKMLLGIGLVALAAPGTAQQKIGVIDVARIMTESFDAVLAMSTEYHTTPRIAAFMLAIRRVTEVIMLRGVYA